MTSLTEKESNEWVEGVRAFHRDKLPFNHLPSIPTLPSPEELLIESSSLMKEFEEIHEAMAYGNLELILDGAVDTIYVLIGLCLKCGVDPTYVMAEVQRSNMDKLPAAPGTIGRKTASGGSMKPHNWIGPRIVQIIAELWQKHPNGYAVDL